MNPFCHQQGERINYLFLAIKVGSEIINVLNPATEARSKAISYGREKKIFSKMIKTFYGHSAKLLVATMRCIKICEDQPIEHY